MFDISADLRKNAKFNTRKNLWGKIKLFKHFIFPKVLIAISKMCKANNPQTVVPVENT